VIALCCLICGCWSRPENRVVIYSAQDREYAEPLLQRYQRDHSVPVDPKFDAESTKTVGLANALLAEYRRPRCDVFWNNEILHTLRLEKAGLLAPLPKELLEPFPEAYRSRDHLWCVASPPGPASCW
jgi:iron(III) transport system substrate-binding protein